MSAPGHASDSDVHEAHDHYEGIAADRAAPDEPDSPAWLPLLGLGLLLFAVLGYVVTRPAGKTAAELAAAAEPTAAAAEAKPAPEAERAPTPPPRARPAAPGNMPRLPRPGASVVQPGRPPGVFTLPGGNRPAPGQPDPHAGHDH